MTTARDIDWFMRAYARAFSSLQPAAMAGFYDEPCMVTMPEGSAIFHDGPELVEALDRVIDFYRNHGIARAELVGVKVEEPGVLVVPPFAFAHCHWRLWSTRDLPVVGFHTSYVTRRTDQGWKIVSAVAHDEMQNFGRLRAG